MAYGLMVSDSNMPGREGWPLVDPLGASVCDPSAVEAHRDSLPPVVHYCQVRGSPPGFESGAHARSEGGGGGVPGRAIFAFHGYAAFSSILAVSDVIDLQIPLVWDAG